MIHADKFQVVRTLSEAGKSKKEIARLLSISVKTVRRHLKEVESGGKAAPRPDKKTVDEELLREIYTRCDGYRQRMLEILAEESGVDIGYSTLTRLLRELEIGYKPKLRHAHVEDSPGAEMQHDTSPYRLKLGNDLVLVQGSSIYLRYSKMRYVKFYRSFNRFRMKCFFHEALSHWGYAARTCVVDNTNLAVLHGTGKAAVFHPEMIAFAKPLGFAWLAHEKGHSNRKAGEERNFWTVETNFLPGRTFTGLNDLNAQALAWCKRFAQRPQSKTRLIPQSLFESEKCDLFKLPGYLDPPYLHHQRIVDSYGYIAFGGNYYWIPPQVPGTRKLPSGKIDLLEYADAIKIFPGGLSKNQSSLVYPLPAAEIRNQRFAPAGANLSPYSPRQFKQSCQEEEQKLRATDPVCGEYLDFIHGASEVHYKPKFIRELYQLSRPMATSLFTATLARALRYKVCRLQALQRISRQLLQAEHPEFSQAETLARDYEQRQVYQEGRFSPENPMDYPSPQPSPSEESEEPSHE